MAGAFGAGAFGSDETLVTVRGIRPPALDSLRHMRDGASRAAVAAREPAWYEVARYAVFLATATAGAPKDIAAARAILKDACDRLPASSLAAAAAHGHDPIVSLAFARAILEANLAARGPDVSPRAEAASECRDALARFGPDQAAELASLWRRVGPAGFGAGGASASVYRIELVGSEFADSASADAGFAAGFREGVAAEAGPLASRFVISAWGSLVDAVPWRVPSVKDGMDNSIGIFVVASGSADAHMATGLAVAGRVVTVDARNPETISPEDVEMFPDLLPGQEPLHVDPGRYFADNLRYQVRPAGGLGPAARVLNRWRPNFVSAPNGFERARRLVQWIGSKPQIERVGVALPETGGDVALARACLAILPEGRRARPPVVIPISYQAGRRAYTAEAIRLRETGCQAVVLCGPAEESAEWFLAMRAAKLRPLVFGGSELDPAGFHDAVRTAAEGAVFVDSNWRVRGSLRNRLEAAGQAAGRASDGRDFERGFLVGKSIARRIVAGNCSTGLLRDALEDESPLMSAFGQRRLNPGDDPTNPGSAEVEIPLYRIHNGVAERIEFP